MTLKDENGILDPARRITDFLVSRIKSATLLTFSWSCVSALLTVSEAPFGCRSLICILFLSDCELFLVFFHTRSMQLSMVLSMDIDHFMMVLFISLYNHQKLELS